MDEVEAVKAAIANTTGMASRYSDSKLRDVALAAIAALDAARGDPVAQVVEWQPIETAPTDGTWVQLWGPDGYRGCGRCWRNIDFEDATHWQPIPTGPERGEPFNG